MHRPLPSAPRALALAMLAMVLALMLPSHSAVAATLHSGDVLLLARDGATPPVAVLHLDVAAGAFDAIVPHPALSDPRDIAVRPDGMIMVADATLGLVGVAAGSGAATVLAGPAAFGGSGPTALAFAANGDLLLAGPAGIARLLAGQLTPTIVSGAGLLITPTGVLDDDAGGMWITDDNNRFPVGGGIFHVSASGEQTKLNASCSSSPSPGSSVYAFPVAPLAIRRGPDGFVYVVSAPYEGPSYYNDAGIFRMDPATGVATIWSTAKFPRGFDFTPGGGLWLSSCTDISRSCYYSVLGGSAGLFYPAGRGPIALVPAITTPTLNRSWGSLKSAYR